MGFDLRARHKDVEECSFGAFSWPIMLDRGVGLPLGCGKGITPCQYVYRAGPKDKGSPYSNDGFRVTAKKAREMAQVACWLADYQDTLRGVYEQMPQERRDEMDKDYSGTYTLPIRTDFVEKFRKFAEWAEKSGGFTIH